MRCGFSTSSCWCAQNKHPATSSFILSLRKTSTRRAWDLQRAVDADVGVRCNCYTRVGPFCAFYNLTYVWKQVLRSALYKCVTLAYIEACSWVLLSFFSCKSYFLLLSTIWQFYNGFRFYNNYSWINMRISLLFSYYLKVKKREFRGCLKSTWTKSPLHSSHKS